MFKYLSLLLIILSFSINTKAANYQNASARVEGNYMVFFYDIPGSNTKQFVVGIQIRTKGHIYSTRNLHLEGDVRKYTGMYLKIFQTVYQKEQHGVCLCALDTTQTPSE